MGSDGADQTEGLKMGRKYLRCAETAKLVRQALKESFPCVKFSIRSSTYSGGASINVSWVDGPTSKQVEQVTDAFCGGYFDGMIDYKGSVYHKLDGESVHFGADFIFTRREVSDATVWAAINDIAQGYNVEPITVEAYRQGRAWNWKNAGGCDLGSALNGWFEGKHYPGTESWHGVDQGMEALPSMTLARVEFDGSDEYGQPYGSNGYPRAA
jgi:hypothetical protein